MHTSTMLGWDIVLRVSSTPNFAVPINTNAVDVIAVTRDRSYIMATAPTHQVTPGSASSPAVMSPLHSSSPPLNYESVGPARRISADDSVPRFADLPCSLCEMFFYWCSLNFNWKAPWKNRISRYISFFRPSLISDFLFTGGKGVSDFSVLNYY